MNTPDHSKAWNPWPVAIIAFFALFIAGVVAFVIFATRQQVDLVRPDYYAEEMRYQGQLDRLNRTRSISSRVAVDFDRREQHITIALPREQAAHRPTGRIQLYRPSNANLDRTVPLAVDAAGVQQMDATKLQAGLWKVRVQWSVNGEEFFVDRVVVVEPPQS